MDELFCFDGVQFDAWLGSSCQLIFAHFAESSALAILGNGVLPIWEMRYRFLIQAMPLGMPVSIID